ncbi:MAG: arsenite methyltransferase, partial [Candidatus Eisenbacteria bacterium]|nr:arsenite methyltransferase [Candidatus Eisenbacteria bacterium]
MSDNELKTQEQVRDAVRRGYADIAVKGTERRADADESSSCCGGGGCCGGSPIEVDELASKLGYAREEIEALPGGANLGLSCGNPTAIAMLAPGEVVLDLGSGAGFDCFLAGPKVGPMGRVIGVDMTAEMLSRARASLSSYRERTGFDNVEFRLGEIENLPVADGTVDVVLSNCVLNLSPDKARVWKEIARVLKPGGRVAISDLALLQPLPKEVTEMVEALVGCVAGATLVETTRRMMEEAGLVGIELRAKPEYIDAMTSWEDPLYRDIIAHLPEGAKVSEYVTSLDIAGR